MSYWNKHTYHYLALIILIGIAIVGWIIQIPQQEDNLVPQVVNELTQDETDVIGISGEVNLKNDENVYTTVDIPAISTTLSTTTQVETEARDEPEAISNTLVVEDKKYTLSYTKNTSVFKFMTALEKNGFSFASRNYGADLGYFITQIHGKKNDDIPGYYWIYYINDAKATIGVSNYILKPHDIIEWKYEEAEY